ncbi:TatD family hydrolase [Halopseudomonas pachastrellae]|nr:TatD family hydrolase [Halopseudomonas pachastrellae]
MCQQHTNLYAAFGLHPMFMAEHAAEHVAALQQCLAERLEDARCCAVGEFGLDYWDKGADRAAQQQLFEAQLQLAVEYQLPSLLHVRKAHADVIATLKRYRPARGGIIHAFSGSPEQHASTTSSASNWAWAAQPPGHRQPACAIDHCTVAREQLLLETDSPGYGPRLPRPQRNSPALLPQSARSWQHCGASQ